VADLRVDYQLPFGYPNAQHLGWDSRTLAIRSAVTIRPTGLVPSPWQCNFSGNWSNHRKRLLAEMGNLGQLTDAAERRFRQADGKLAGDVAGQ
jgi:hypothetical protein